MEKFDFITQFANLNDKIELKDLLNLPNDEYQNWLNENMDENDEQVPEF